MLLVDHGLGRRLEIAHAWRGIRYAQAQRTLRPDIASAFEPIAGGYAIYAGQRFPVNRATGVGFRGPVATTDMEFIDKFFQNCGIPPRVDLCPLADPSLLKLLKEGGYRLERFFNVLARPIPDNAAPASLPPEVEVKRAGQNEAELWLHTVAQGFSGQENPPQDVLDILAPNYHSATAICFLAWAHGQPAGGGALVTHDGVAELCSASTRPAFRGRGIQTALLQTRLAAAREASCDLAQIVASPGAASQRNAERVGFRLAYTKAIMVKE